MNEYMIKQNDKAVEEGSLRKKGKENAGFKNALLIKPVTSGVDHNGQDIPKGIENINLCSDSFLTDKKRNSESKICEMNFKDCLSSDLLKRIEEGSPIKSSRTFKNERTDMNYMTNYTDKNEDDPEGQDEEEENSENPKLSFKDPHSRFYGKNNMINEMENFYLLDDNNLEFTGSSSNCQQEKLKNLSMNVVQEKSLSGSRVPYTMPFLHYCHQIENPNKNHDQAPNYHGNQTRNYFNFEKEENFGNYINNSNQIKNNCIPNQNLHRKYGFSEEETANTTGISPSNGRFFHLDENIAFYPKNYNQISKDRISQTTTNLMRQREIHSQNCIGQNPSNLFNDFSFNQSVNNLFKNKLEKLENNVEDHKINSLMFAEEQRSDRQNLTTQYKLDTPNIVSPCNMANNSKSLIPFSNNSKKQNSISPQTQLMNPNQFNQSNTKEIMKSKCIQNSNPKLYMHGKSGWTCNNCKNFNYESKNFIFYFKNLARIKCNRCGRPQIKNMSDDKEINANDSNGDSNIASISISSANKTPIDSLSLSNNMIYNKNPKFASSQNGKNTCNSTTTIISSKEPLCKKTTIQNEFNLNGYEQIKDSIESTKDSLSTAEISLKANSSDLKKKKKPFVERVGDWVCIKCKNLNFSFRLICNRCQLTKQESENLFEQYMKNLMNYVKLNEILQNQIFNNSNLNNLIEFNGVNNQLMSNLNKNFQQNKLNIPNDPNLLNYLKTKCVTSNGFSPKTNYSTEESNSTQGVCDNHNTEDSPGDKLGNKSK